MLCYISFEFYRFSKAYIFLTSNSFCSSCKSYNSPILDSLEKISFLNAFFSSYKFVIFSLSSAISFL